MTPVERFGSLFECPRQVGIEQAVMRIHLSPDLAKKFKSTAIYLHSVAITQRERLVEQRYATPIFGEFGQVNYEVFPAAGLCRYCLQCNKRFIE